MKTSTPNSFFAIRTVGPRSPPNFSLAANAVSRGSPVGMRVVFCQPSSRISVRGGTPPAANRSSPSRTLAALTS